MIKKVSIESAKRNILVNSKVWNMITKYQHYKDLAEKLDGDDNNVILFEYYFNKMNEAQLNAYQLICAFKCFSFLELIDM